MIEKINKSIPSLYNDESFNNFVDKYKAELNATGKPNLKYFNLLKKKILNELIKENKGKCSYCGKDLTGRETGEIDHFYPRSKYPKLVFDWNNLFLSCRTCNMLKGDRIPENIINPSEDEPSNNLRMNEHGVLIPKTDKGINTINMFDLNSKDLIEQRLRENIPYINIYNNSSSVPKGEEGLSDQIAYKDFLGRDVLVKKLCDFYVEYSEEVQVPFYIGIFSRWGMGKSSFVELLSRQIANKASSKNEYVVCKVDCSLFHRKEKLWITILNRVLDELSTKEIREKKIFKWRFPTFKTKFFWKNFGVWVMSKWRWILASLILFLLLGGYTFYIDSSLIPKIPIPQDYKETAALITVFTLVITLFKTRTLLFKQNVFLQDDRNEESSFIRSVNEYKQLVDLLNKVKKNKDLKVLLVLDELDRMHKDLFPDIIELVQLFKGLNNEQVSKVDSQSKSKEIEKDKIANKSLISFVFSFNHDILFPVVGKNISLGDKQLFINSYSKYGGYVQCEGKDAFINYYKLGKEFMDKYLDLSIYLEEEIDYSKLTDELFKDKSVDRNDENMGFEGSIDEKNERMDEENVVAPEDDSNPEHNNNGSTMPSFSTIEREIIKETIKNYASTIEPRKIIRLKNALIMLKKLNPSVGDIQGRKHEEELRNFILDFLEIKKTENEITETAHQEVAAAIESNLNSNSPNENNESILKYTDYFIHKR